jgi:large subunit ribosomal protein L24
MKIRKGDNIIVIAGKDRGKTGKVLEAFPERSSVLVEGVNLKKKHQKPQRSNQKGQIVETARPVHVSNVMVVDPSTGKRTRIGFKMEGGKKVRMAKKSKSVLN